MTLKKKRALRHRQTPKRQAVKRSLSLLRIILHQYDTTFRRMGNKYFCNSEVVL